MLIKYTGPKSQKLVQFSTGQQREYLFAGDEPQEVVNAEHLRFFLSPDRKGLFENVNEPEATEPRDDDGDERPSRRRGKRR